MGYCTDDQYDRFMQQTPQFEKMLIDDGLILRKYWFSVSDAEQLKRFRSRAQDPVRRWKLSPMDLESINRWEDYSRAKDAMMVHTDTDLSPWFVVESDIKKHARLNMMAHLIGSIPYTEVPAPQVDLPDRLTSTTGYTRPPREQYHYVPDHAAALIGTLNTLTSVVGAEVFTLVGRDLNVAAAEMGFVGTDSASTRLAVSAAGRPGRR